MRPHLGEPSPEVVEGTRVVSEYFRKDMETT